MKKEKDSTADVTGEEKAAEEAARVPAPVREADARGAAERISIPPHTAPEKIPCTLWKKVL